MGDLHPLDPLDRAVALKAISTPLVEAADALAFLQDRLLEAGLVRPFAPEYTPAVEEPAESIAQREAAIRIACAERLVADVRAWAADEWRPKLLEVEGLHPIEVLSTEIRANARGYGLRCLYRHLETRRVHLYYVSLARFDGEGVLHPHEYARADSLLQQTTTNYVHDEMQFDPLRAMPLRYVTIKRLTTKSGPFHLHTWHRHAPSKPRSALQVLEDTL